MQVIVASKNKGKLLEFARILAPFDIEVLSMEEAGFTDEIEETGETFVENACIKAKAIYQKTGKAVIADDSGLAVTALGGRPGVYSARYGGEDLDHPGKILLLQKEMAQSGNPDRSAQYECAIAFVTPQGEVHTFQGSCPGEIGQECRGDRGFGYDPIFYVGERSMAEYTDAEKDTLSHRGKALRACAAALPILLKTL